jgi:hypothetical protein
MHAWNIDLSRNQVEIKLATYVGKHLNQSSFQTKKQAFRVGDARDKKSQ